MRQEKIATAKKKVTQKAGDALEKVGKTIAKTGVKTGAKVYKAGNKLEHSQDDE